MAVATAAVPASASVPGGMQNGMKLEEKEQSSEPTKPDNHDMFNQRCTCCPYGYHIDLDFLRYLDSLRNQSQTLTLHRVKPSKSKRSPTRHESDEFSTSNKQTKATENFVFEQKKSSTSEIVSSNEMPAVNLLSPTMRRDIFLILPEPPEKSDQENSQILDQKYRAATELFINNPVNVTIKQGSSDESDIRRSFRKQQENSRDVVDAGVKDPGVVTSAQLEQSMAALMLDRNGSGRNSVPLANSSDVSSAVLQTIRSQMAVSLQRMRELEEQVKIIPILQEQVSLLRRENLKLTTSTEINTRTSSNTTVHQKLTEFVSTINSKPSTKTIGIGDSDVFSQTESTPLPLSTDFVEFESQKTEAYQSADDILCRKDTRNVGILCKPARKDVSTSSKPHVVNACVGDEMCLLNSDEEILRPTEEESSVEYIREELTVKFVDPPIIALGRVMYSIGIQCKLDSLDFPRSFVCVKCGGTILPAYHRRNVVDTVKTTEAPKICHSAEIVELAALLEDSDSFELESSSVDEDRDPAVEETIKPVRRNRRECLRVIELLANLETFDAAMKVAEESSSSEAAAPEQVVEMNTDEEIAGENSELSNATSPVEDEIGGDMKTVSKLDETGKNISTEDLGVSDSSEVVTEPTEPCDEEIHESQVVDDARVNKISECLSECKDEEASATAHVEDHIHGEPVSNADDVVVTQLSDVVNIDAERVCDVNETNREEEFSVEVKVALNANLEKVLDDINDVKDVSMSTSVESKSGRSNDEMDVCAKVESNTNMETDKITAKNPSLEKNFTSPNIVDQDPIKCEPNTDRIEHTVSERKHSQISLSNSDMEEMKTVSTPQTSVGSGKSSYFSLPHVVDLLESSESESEINSAERTRKDDVKEVQNSVCQKFEKKVFITETLIERRLIATHGDSESDSIEKRSRSRTSIEHSTSASTSFTTGSYECTSNTSKSKDNIALNNKENRFEEARFESGSIPNASGSDEMFFSQSGSEEKGRVSSKLDEKFYTPPGITPSKMSATMSSLEDRSSMSSEIIEHDTGLFDVKEASMDFGGQNTSLPEYNHKKSITTESLPKFIVDLESDSFETNVSTSKTLNSNDTTGKELEEENAAQKITDETEITPSETVDTTPDKHDEICINRYDTADVVDPSSIRSEESSNILCENVENSSTSHERSNEDDKTCEIEEKNLIPQETKEKISLCDTENSITHEREKIITLDDTDDAVVTRPDPVHDIIDTSETDVKIVTESIPDHKIVTPHEADEKGSSLHDLDIKGITPSVSVGSIERDTSVSESMEYCSAVESIAPVSLAELSGEVVQRLSRMSENDTTEYASCEVTDASCCGDEELDYTLHSTQTPSDDELVLHEDFEKRYEDPVDNFLEACLVYSNWVADPSSVSELDKNASLDYVRKQWFTTSSRKTSNAGEVKELLATFQSFGELLLKNVVNLVDNDGNTAMHYAVSHGNASIIETLLETGVCDVDRQNNAGYTVIMLSALLMIDTEKNCELVRALFETGDINVTSVKSGQTALMLAASHGRNDTVSLLLECGADVNIQDEDGSTALMCASEHGHIEIIQTLLGHPHCNSTLSDIDGSTALSIAMEEGYHDIGVLIYAHMKSHGAILEEDERGEEDED